MKRISRWAYVAILATVVHLCNGQAYNTGRDPCVDEVYQRFNTPLLSRYMQYANFTNSLPTSRNVYQSMFLQGFTSPAFYDYCTTYRRARYEFDRCSWSQYKDMVVNGYGLADFICIYRVHDFARHLPCLQNAHFFTFQTCSPRCYQFQNMVGQGPYYPGGTLIGQSPYPGGTFIGGMMGGYGLPYGGAGFGYGSGFGSSGMIGYSDVVNQRMAADCQYQRCLAECRRPLFEQQCGRDASRLEMEALYTTYAAIRNIHEPPELRRQYERGYYDRGYNGRVYSTNTFPAECYALAINSAVSIEASWSVLILCLLGMATIL